MTGGHKDRQTNKHETGILRKIRTYRRTLRQTDIQIYLKARSNIQNFSRNLTENLAEMANRKTEVYPAPTVQSC